MKINLEDSKQNERKKKCFLHYSFIYFIQLKNQRKERERKRKKRDREPSCSSRI